MKTVGEIIADLRIARHWSQHELARRSGIGQAHVSLIEHDVHSPNLKTLASLSRALDVSLSELTGL